MGPVWVLDITLTADGHTIAAWCCKAHGEPQRADYDAATVAKGIAVVTVSGHGTIAKSVDSQVAARVREDGATFLATRSAGQLAFVRHERLEPLRAALSDVGIRPQAVFVGTTPAEAAQRWRAGLRWRDPLRLTDEGSALAQALVRRSALPVLGAVLGLLLANALAGPSLRGRRQQLEARLAACERTAATASETDARQRLLLEEFAARPGVPRAVLCDRIAAAVPERVVLTRLSVEPLAGRFEAEKPLRRNERTALVAGTAQAAGDVSLFVERLAAEACCRTVRLEHVERERDAERLVFRIALGL